MLPWPALKKPHAGTLARALTGEEEKPAGAALVTAWGIAKNGPTVRALGLFERLHTRERRRMLPAPEADCLP